MEDVKLKEKIKAFLSVDHGYGSGYGSGDGSGYGDGYGSGYGSGDGSGYGDGYGYGDGSGYGYGDGSGYGDGDGDGYGDGSGYGDGYGSGYGDGLDNINGKKIYRIDDTPTIISSVKGNVAKGYIVQSDLSLTPCFVAKGNNLFAHGNDLHEAMAALTDKMFDDMPEEERIAEFIKAHPDKDKAYPNQDLFDWHHRLTGSCMAGRNAFVKDRGLTLDGETTVTDFIKLTENAYGGSTIRKLAEQY